MRIDKNVRVIHKNYIQMKFSYKKNEEEYIKLSSLFGLKATES